ncbi:MAG TPA: DUF1622 domain-containing protein [bacterium]|nr:DUF1622 domain-containing protein [bacterium]
MEKEVVSAIVNYSVAVIEVLGVAAILIGIVLGGIYALFRLAKGEGGVFKTYRIQIGRALQLGLEFLVAADIIRTVTVRPTLQEILALGLLVLIRTFLSWSVSVETDGRWPWQAARDVE